MVRKIVLNLDSFKATPVKGIYEDYDADDNDDIHLPFITKATNFSFANNCFADGLKLAEVSTVFKNNDDQDKEKYRPLSVLSHVSEVFERIVLNIS